MGWVEVLTMREARLARRCWVYIGGVDEDEVVVVRAGDVYVVGTVLGDWYVVPPDTVRRFLARWFNVSEEEVSLEC
jgi:hypothetical protein